MVSYQMPVLLMEQHFILQTSHHQQHLTNVTNTKLLCCQSNTSAVDTAVVPGTAPNTRNWSARSNWNSGGTLTNASSYPLTAAFDGNLSTTFAMSYAGGMIGQHLQLFHSLRLGLCQ